MPSERRTEGGVGGGCGQGVRIDWRSSWAAWEGSGGGVRTAESKIVLWGLFSAWRRGRPGGAGPGRSQIYGYKRTSFPSSHYHHYPPIPPYILPLYYYYFNI